MTEERFDAIVVGAGPSGNAAAYTMAKAGLNVLQLERGEYPGSKNVQGAILYANALEKLMPDFRDDAPLERHVIEQRIWMMDDLSHTGMHYRSEMFNEDKPNRYTIIRAQFDRWFSRRVRDAGATLLCETTVTELLRDTKDRVIGVRTDRHGGALLADVVILAEGVNGLIGQTSGLREELKPKDVALAVKEMHFLPEEVIESRFGLRGAEGVVIEAMGTITKGMTGTAFLYTNREFISIGIGCLVDDFTLYGTNAVRTARRIQSASKRGTAAHRIGGEGIRRSPDPGRRLQLRAATFWRRLAGGRRCRTSGERGASRRVQSGNDIRTPGGRNDRPAEAHPRSLQRGESAAYRKLLDESFVMKDMKKYRKIPGLLHGNNQFLDLYPRLLSKAAQTWLRVDGVDKISKEREILRTMRSARGLRGLLGDVYKVARAWR